jgi:transposase InsO family protein
MDTAAHRKIVLTQNTKDPCPHCVNAKIRMENIPEQVNNPSTRKMERLLIDLSWIKTASFTANRYWLLFMDDYTNFIWSFFLKNKNDVTDTLITLLLQLQNETKLSVEFSRCDNSGENNQIQTDANVHPHMHFKFEYTALENPQQNGKIERKFATLYGKSRAVLNAGKFNWPLRHKMWAYSANQATDLENIIVQPGQKATAYELFYDGNPEWLDSLHTFGEIAFVRDPVKIRSKLKNQGFPAIYLGPAKFHAKNVHNFWNPMTQCSLTSRNIVFLNRNYADYYKLSPENVAHLIAAVKNDDTEEFDENADEDNPDDENPFINMYPHMDVLDAEPDGGDDEDLYDKDDLDLHDVNHPDYMPPHVQDRLLGPGVPREIRNLQTFYNPNPGIPEEQDENELLEAAIYAKRVPEPREDSPLSRRNRTSCNHA